ncbi:MAG: ribonuclease P protein component [Pseudomonadota bacterium]
MAPTFRPEQRLLKADEFVAVLRRPQLNISRGPLRLRAIQNRMPGARLGLVVTKKGNPLAVRRNRLKRLMRETFRKRAYKLPPTDIVVQIFAPIEDARLREEMDRVLKTVEEKFADAE